MQRAAGLDEEEEQEGMSLVAEFRECLELSPDCPTTTLYVSSLCNHSHVLQSSAHYSNIDPWNQIYPLDHQLRVSQ